jgi:hypothetical protein
MFTYLRNYGTNLRQSRTCLRSPQIPGLPLSRRFTQFPCPNLSEVIEESMPVHRYEVRPRPDRRAFDLISDQVPFGRLWYTEADAGLLGFDRVWARLQYVCVIW